MSLSLRYKQNKKLMVYETTSLSISAVVSLKRRSTKIKFIFHLKYFLINVIKKFIGLIS